MSYLQNTIQNIDASIFESLQTLEVSESNTRCQQR